MCVCAYCVYLSRRLAERHHRKPPQFYVSCSRSSFSDIIFIVSQRNDFKLPMRQLDVRYAMYRLSTEVEW